MGVKRYFGREGYLETVHAGRLAIREKGKKVVPFLMMSRSRAFGDSLLGNASLRHELFLKSRPATPTPILNFLSF